MPSVTSHERGAPGHGVAGRQRRAAASWSAAQVARRALRWVAGACIAILIPASALGQDKPNPRGLDIAPITVTAKPIASFDRTNSAQKRFGKLEFRGGLELTSSNKNFGGWSGIVVEPDGKRFAAVSDAGSWMTGEITYEGTRPSGMARVQLGPLLAMGSKSLKRGRDRDAEAITLASGSLTSGTLYIGFERNHRIGRFDIVDGVIGPPLTYLKLPAQARQMSTNKGFEAMAALHGGAHKGSIIAFSERLHDKTTGHHTGWIWSRGEPHRLNLKDIGEFDITGATGLPNGDLIILERRFRWFEGVKMRLRRVKARDIRPGAVLEGEVLLSADMTSEIDNMEGVAAHRGPRGETVITLISDDNFNHFLQRNLLLQFALTEAQQASAAGRAQ